MSQTIKQSLSACIDGEATNEELRRVIDETLSNEELKRDWADYSSISAVLRGDKLTVEKELPDWNKLAASFPDDSNIVSLQNRGRVNRRTMVRSASVVLGLAATLVLGIAFLSPFFPGADDQATNLADSQTTSAEGIASNDPVDVSGVRASNVVNLPDDMQERHMQYLLEHDKNVTVVSGTPLTIPKVVSRKASTTP